MPSFQRGICSVCGGNYATNLTGGMWAHGHLPGGGLCRGSYKPALRPAEPAKHKIQLYAVRYQMEFLTAEKVVFQREPSAQLVAASSPEEARAKVEEGEHLMVDGQGQSSGQFWRCTVLRVRILDPEKFCILVHLSKDDMHVELEEELWLDIERHEFPYLRAALDVASELEDESKEALLSPESRGRWERAQRAGYEAEGGFYPGAKRGDGE